MGIIRFFKRLFCNHNDIRYWGHEEVVIHGRQYKKHTGRCMKCGLDFIVRERI